MKTSRIIFHIDMNCFFASCEIAENEELKGKPIVVAHDDPLQRGLILSPSYEARKFGIKTTMKVKDAFKLCKDIVVVEPDMKLYSHYSRCFNNYLLTITKKVEMASIDEAYLDVSDMVLNQGKNALELANEMQQYLLNTYNLPSSIGIAPNKFLAKMASDMKKPLGITVLRKREIDKYMWPLPIGEMFGVGKKTAPKLKEIGINTIGDLANYKNIELLKKTVGENSALSLQRLANGIEDSEVNYMPNDDFSYVSNAHTFDTDVYDINVIKNTLKLLCGTISYRLDNKNYEAKTIGLKVNYSNFQFFNKSKGLDKGTSDSNLIYNIVEDLFDDYCNVFYGVRLVSVYAQRVSPIKKDNIQISIFDNMNEIEKEEEVKKIINQVKNKFGNNIIKKGYYSYTNNNKDNS